MFKGKFWIFLVLTSFIFLLVPRNLWHDCEQSHAVEHHHPKQKSFQKGHCPVCDFELYTATVHRFETFWFGKATYQQFNFYAERQCIVPFRHLKLRGPPDELNA